MGALLSSFGSVGQAVQGSTALSALGTGVSAAGQLFGGIGQSQQYNYMAQVASNNAAITHANEQAGLVANSIAESEFKTKTGLTIATQKAAQSANGLDINIGSPVAVREATQHIGDIDAAMIHYNASREAFGLETQAANDRAQAGLDSTAAKNAIFKGLYGAGSTILSGASSLNQKWAQYKMSGAA